MKLFCIVPSCNRDRHLETNYCIVHQPPYQPPCDMLMEDKTFDQFMTGVRDLMKHKGESTCDMGADDNNPTFEFVKQHCPGASGGEIIYKVIRYQKKHDPMDLLKIAGWAFLAWKHGTPTQGR